ncbi:hypothetical protein MB46_03395 [Arthrobacter alpinus]|uniref:hypothetical protein n=1 Tax=Arthrobacter alpinus TaxID=656366 RepID=UPI0005CA2F5B|nr:hypothetical protein [Arthrobacter alpinus]ALV44696.1 hypothetical protein MB46_03395 [Arthrobacter alpinus]
MTSKGPKKSSRKNPQWIEDAMPKDRPTIASRTAMTGEVEVAPGVIIPDTYETWWPDRDGYEVELSAKITENFRIEVFELTVRRRDDGPAVTGEGVRGIAIQALVREVIQGQVRDSFHTDGPYGTKGFGMLQESQAERLRKLGPAPETLEWVARVYKVAELLDEPPTVSIQETFGISRSTAGAWIGRARSAELLAKPRNSNA